MRKEGAEQRAKVGESAEPTTSREVSVGTGTQEGGRKRMKVGLADNGRTKEEREGK